MEGLAAGSRRGRNAKPHVPVEIHSRRACSSSGSIGNGALVRCLAGRSPPPGAMGGTHVIVDQKSTQPPCQFCRVTMWATAAQGPLSRRQSPPSGSDEASLRRPVEPRRGPAARARDREVVSASTAAPTEGSSRVRGSERDPRGVTLHQLDRSEGLQRRLATTRRSSRTVRRDHNEIWVNGSPPSAAQVRVPRYLTVRPGVR